MAEDLVWPIISFLDHSRTNVKDSNQSMQRAWYPAYTKLRFEMGLNVKDGFGFGLRFCNESLITKLWKDFKNLTFPITGS